MEVLSFLHQKGGTGKSTLAIATACALAAQGRPALLLDADPQGTSSDWGNRHGHRCGVEVCSQARPITPAELYALQAPRLVIDGPPGLTPMTQSIVECSGRIIVPCLPAPPDLWALAWLGAMIGRQSRTGVAPEARLVFTHYRGEDLGGLTRGISTEWGLTIHPDPLPWDQAFIELFEGRALPEELSSSVLRAVGYG